MSGGVLCVRQITALRELAPSTVSAHLADLRWASLLAERRDGRCVYYGLAPWSVSDTVRRLLRGLDADPTVLAGAEAVRRLRAIPVDEFCALDTENRARVAAPAAGKTAP